MLALLFELHETLFNMYGALLVALVAGAFSLLGLTISKENKISEFRQEWIDGLREDVSVLIAQAQLIHSELARYLDRLCSYGEYIEKCRTPYVDLNSAGSRIKLRLNLTEPDSRSLMKSLRELHDLLEPNASDGENYRARFGPASKAVEMNAAVVLSNEWRRVKAGEGAFRWGRRIAIGIIALAVLLAVLLLGFGGKLFRL
jgi:hypothetical protein